MKLSSSRRKRRGRIEIIPLIDIMFFLLASFMMLSLELQKVFTLKAHLPTATAATSTTKTDMITVTVDKFGQVSVEDKALTFPDLMSLLTNRAKANPDVPVFVTGSRETTHGAMMYVLDYAKRAGIKRAAIGVRLHGS